MSSPLPPNSPQQPPVPPRPGSQPPSYAAPQAPGSQAHQPPRPPQGPTPARPPQASQATTLGATNTFAFLAILFGFIFPILGIIFGHMGLGQVKRTGDAGRGLALTGLIVGYVFTGLLLLFWVLYFGFIAVAIGSALSYESYSSTY
ncbi:DUF4190 domain-containing protein [Leucobacter sp. CSA1]|uniref:DUF4190 domain-containing protein n=1 Tax=Leucobacter chromiisoli TaxID=2796471 RepID=A0A934Q8E9_9MICO|nr:DUF4190 domain-containing protein [Leucobacter chromiisoli]MBK0419741.1 DUF4190 domain-containing protein [Leucobacter chromiisoli]